MLESTALVPVPFYPPVRAGTGAFFKFGEKATHPLILEQGIRSVTPELDDGMAYNRDGRFIDDTHIGTLVNIYI